MCAPCRTPFICVIRFLLIGVVQEQSVNRAIEPERIIDRDPPTLMTGSHITGAHTTAYGLYRFLTH